LVAQGEGDITVDVRYVGVVAATRVAATTDGGEDGGIGGIVVDGDVAGILSVAVAPVVELVAHLGGTPDAGYGAGIELAAAVGFAHGVVGTEDGDGVFAVVVLVASDKGNGGKDCHAEEEEDFFLHFVVFF